MCKVILVAAISLCLRALPAEAVTTDEVLAKMDQAAPKFNGMWSDLNRITYTKVIDDKASESGTMLLRKMGPRELQVLIDITKPDLKTVAFRGRKAEIYYPKMKTVEEWDLGKHTDLVNQFLVVGFGTSGDELKANYSVKLGGEETVGGEKAYKLELVPNSAQTKQNISRLELWISEGGIYPIQQKILKPSGDYYLFTYSNVKLNPPLGDDVMRLKLPKGIKRISPQK